jgi:hypothetical protein
LVSEAKQNAGKDKTKSIKSGKGYYLITNSLLKLICIAFQILTEMKKVS